MAPKDILLSVTFESNVDTQSEQLMQLATDLRDELRSIDGIEARLYQEGLSQDITSRGDAVTIGTVIISLASAGVLTGLIQVIQAWMSRKKDAEPQVRIKIQVGDKLAEFDYSPVSVKQNDLIRFVEAIVHEIDKPSKNEGGRKLQNGKKRMGKKHKG